MDRNDYTKPLKSFFKFEDNPEQLPAKTGSDDDSAQFKVQSHFHVDRPFLELFPRFFD